MWCGILTTIHMSTRPEGFLDLDKILLNMVFYEQVILNTHTHVFFLFIKYYSILRIKYTFSHQPGIT